MPQGKVLTYCYDYKRLGLGNNEKGQNCEPEAHNGKKFKSYHGNEDLLLSLAKRNDRI